MTEKKERPLFKIWDKKNNHYVSGDKSKTTWRSEKWIASKLRDLCKSHWGKRDINDFEVRTFELQLIKAQPASVLFEADEKSREFKRVNKEIATRMENKIGQVFPRINVYQIRQMYKSGALASNHMETLKPLIDNLVQAERTL